MTLPRFKPTTRAGNCVEVTLPTGRKLGKGVIIDDERILLFNGTGIARSECFCSDIEASEVPPFALRLHKPARIFCEERCFYETDFGVLEGTTVIVHRVALFYYDGRPCLAGKVSEYKTAKFWIALSEVDLPSAHRTQLRVVK